jgi:antitoxin MazE
MTKKIKKWGNSLAIRIPKEEASLLGIFEGDEVTIEKRKNTLIIRSKERNLQEMVDRINSKNKHSLEFLEENNKGKEIW